MKIYNYDENGYFISESDAKLDLLETNIQNKQMYLLPKNATFIKVIDSLENKLRRFVNNEWVYEDIVKNDIVISLEEKIEHKLRELDIYHFNSEDVRLIKINDYFILSLSGEGRALIAEQIQTLEQQIKLNVITEESATFEYFYNNESIGITLVQLRQLYVFMMNVVNTNYSIYQTHIQAIKDLSTIKKVEAYNFTSKYLKNKKLKLS